MRSDNGTDIRGMHEDDALKTALIDTVKRREPYWKLGDESIENIDDNADYESIFKSIDPI